MTPTSSLCPTPGGSAATGSMHAILLAAGLGVRLRPLSQRVPKPLVEVGGRSILARTLTVLRHAGARDLTVVVGFEGALVAEAARTLWPGVSIVENPDPGGTGSMCSLALAWESLAPHPDSALVVEGDLVFGPEAPLALLQAGGADLVLLSDPSGAGDEVWVRGREGRVEEVSKGPGSPVDLLGELVGLSLLSAATLHAMVSSHRAAGVEVQGEPYEARIAAVARDCVVRGLRVDGLVWGEVDDSSQLSRVEAVVVPRLEGTAPQPTSTRSLDPPETRA
ncbi:MAG: hypothetical protein FIA95_08030 [Gemmatimonadetes bacterium]|nr:hypothetical protein [Gemmatimonadota bacterium]